MNSTAIDLAHWLLAQMGVVPGVVSPAAVTTLRKPRVRTPNELRRRGWKTMLSDAHYGLGWRIYRFGQEEVVLHSGWVKGYVAEIGYSPTCRIGIVMLLNGESPVLGTLGSRFWAAVADSGALPSHGKN